MVLYINSCVRENSRTDRIARALLSKLGDYTELDLQKENVQALTTETLKKRSAFVEAGDFSDEMFRYAKQFAEADEIVISAPYWDLSFPARLKEYFENIYIVGLTSSYNEMGIPVGLCRAKKLYYVTTAGGPFMPDFGFNYVRDLCTLCFGVKEAELIAAENLDIVGNDAEKIVAETINRIKQL